MGNLCAKSNQQIAIDKVYDTIKSKKRMVMIEQNLYAYLRYEDAETPVEKVQVLIEINGYKKMMIAISKNKRIMDCIAQEDLIFCYVEGFKADFIE